MQSIIKHFLDNNPSYPITTVEVHSTFNFYELIFPVNMTLLNEIYKCLSDQNCNSEIYFDNIRIKFKPFISNKIVDALNLLSLKGYMSKRFVNEIVTDFPDVIIGTRNLLEKSVRRGSQYGLS